jgi:hypothetical protein
MIIAQSLNKNPIFRGLLLVLLLTLALLATARGVAAQGEGVIEGTVTLEGEQALPEGLEVELLFLPNGQGPPVIERQPLDSSGAYRFEAVDTSTQHRYLVRVKHEEEDHFSDLLAFEPGETTQQVTLRVFARTTDTSDLSLSQVTYILDVRSEGWLVAVLYRYHNAGGRIIRDENDPPGFVPLPANATDVQFSDGVQGGGITEVPGGIAYEGPFAPGDTPLIFTYSLPYQQGDQTLTLPPAAPAAQVRVMVPQLGQRTETSDLPAIGIQNGVGGRPFELFELQQPAASQSFAFRFSGLPPAPAPAPDGGVTAPGGMRVLPISPLERLPVWSPLVPVVLVVLGVVAYLAARPAPSTAEQRAALRDRRDLLIAEMARLDNRLEEATIGEQTYKRQRTALKRELKGVLQRLGPARAEQG